MKLRTALAAMVTMGVIAFALALATLVWTVQSGMAVAEGRVHGVLSAIDTSLARAYVDQVRGEQDEHFAPLSAHRLDSGARAITARILASYDGVEGGYYIKRIGHIVGYAFPTHRGPGPKTDVPSAELGAIRGLARRTVRDQTPESATLNEGRGDAVILDATPIVENGLVLGAAWTMQRLPGANNPLVVWQRTLVAAGALLALGLIAFGLWVLDRVRRDVETLVEGLHRLRTDPSWRIATLGGDLGAVAEAVNEMADVRFRAEAEARRSERLASLGRMVASVAHEIRNPLNALRLQAALIARRTNGALSPVVARITSEIERLDAVVVRMLEFGKTPPEAQRTLDLRAIVERAVALLGVEAEVRGTSIRVHAEEPDGSPPAGDPEQIGQVVINLLANALDVSPGGAAIDVLVERAGRIRIIDRGPGIPSALAPHVFEPFVTTKAKGSGLGLAISHEIASAHGARLTFTSEPGRTEFVLDFHRGVPA